VSAHYHNTVPVHGRELVDSERAAQTQDEAVAALFRRYAPLSLSPSQAHKALCTRAPVTSIRRAITNLTTAGVLELTGEQSKGPYGKTENRWRLKGKPTQGKLL